MGGRQARWRRQASARSFPAGIAGRPEFAKRYLQVLVDEIVINGNEVAICGSDDRLALAVQKTKEGNLDQEPSFIDVWRARRDSNARPLPSEGSTLSS